MIRIKSDYLAYIILLSMVLIFPLSVKAQVITETVPIVIASTEVTKQTIIKKDSNSATEDEDDKVPQKDSGFFNFKSDRVKLKQNQTEDKQDKMEKALDLLEVADRLWENGDIENTVETLDEAYALLIEGNGDTAIAQEKDDLRLLIARRILTVYSSKKTLLNGKNSEIPLIMNADVEKEINSFKGFERENFISAYQRSGMYRPVIVKALKKAGIPEEFSWLPLVESFFKINAYSRARALGLWQFIPSTGYKFGLNRDEWVDERMDVQKSTQAAIAYLKELHNMFGDWLTVLAAYNCGEGRVLRVISRQNINYLDSFWDLYRQLPNETARYVPRLLATLHIVNNPQKYGFDLNTLEKPVNFETVKVNKVMKLKDIADKLEVSEEEINLLNSELRHKMTPDHEYDLRLPKDSLDKFNLVANEIPESEKPRILSVRTVFVKHRVRKGETVASIARKYDVSESVIRSSNKLGSAKKLAQGRKLKIPITREKRYASNGGSKQKEDIRKISSSGTYKVKKGETLFAVARNFSVTSDQIKKLNKLKSDKICAGQVLKIPQGDEENDSADKGDKNPTKAAKKSKINKKVLSSNDLDKLGPDKYIVTRNDSLHSIAKKNNINVAKLLELNKISIDEKLVPGQILIVK